MNKKGVLLILFLLIVSSVIGADYRNFYGIGWRGSACDNIDYAKSMGYDFVMYQNGMEKCSNNKNLGFFFEAPDTFGYPDNVQKIYLTRVYSGSQITSYSDFFLWKSNDVFPYNLATGWFSTTSIFKPLPDFQRQEIIDMVINSVLAEIPRRENKANNFYFAGYSWDVATLNGDLWSNMQSIGGKQVTIKNWTGTDSGVLHPGKTFQYSAYKDGLAAFRKKL